MSHIRHYNLCKNKQHSLFSIYLSIYLSICLSVHLKYFSLPLPSDGLEVEFDLPVLAEGKISVPFIM